MSSEGGHRRVELRVEIAHVVLREDLNVVLIILINDLGVTSSAVNVDRRGDQIHVFLEFCVIFYVLGVVRQVEAVACKSLKNIFNT